MTVARIFAELHDWTTWPPPPQQQPLTPLTPEELERWVQETRAFNEGLAAGPQPFDAADMQPGVLTPMPVAALQPWVPPGREADEE